MRRLMSIFFVTLGVVVLLGSCSKQKYEPQLKSEQITEVELLNSLDSINKSLLSEIPGRTRGKFLGFLTVAAADVAGAYELGKIGTKVGMFFGPKGAAAGAVIGGLIGGVGCSYGAYNGLTRGVHDDDIDLMVAAYSYMQDNIEEKNKQKVDDISIDLPQEYSSCLNAGIEHNYMLSVLCEEQSLLTSQEVRIDEDLREILADDEYKEAYYKCVSKSRTRGFDMDVVEADALGKRVMDLFLSLYTKYPEKQDDVNKVINLYISEIEKCSDFTDEEKEIVYSSLSIAGYSFYHWEGEFNEN